MTLIDTHCHLDFPEFDADRELILQRSHARGIEKMILSGVLADGWSRLIDLSKRYPQLYAAPGLHPNFLDQGDPADLERLDHFISNGLPLVAIGETGLDFYCKKDDYSDQYCYFEMQIELAARHQLPLILHVRKAHDQVARLLKQKRFSNGGVVHCYSGSLQQAQRYLDMGFKLGIGGVVTFPGSHRLHRIVSGLPLSSFVLETDAPDIPPYGRTGERNSPEYLTDIFHGFCQYRDEEEDQLREALYQNTIALFRNLGN